MEACRWQNPSPPFSSVVYVSMRSEARSIGIEFNRSLYVRYIAYFGLRPPRNLALGQGHLPRAGTRNLTPAGSAHFDGDSCRSSPKT